jgi:hypothetical protein
MFRALLLMSLVLGQKPEAQNPSKAESFETEEVGIIAGNVVPPAGQTISGPLQVILLTPQYAALWNSDVQKRLDLYWERYKPAFAQNKDFFTEVSKLAYRESLQFVLARMRLELRGAASTFIIDSADDGKFQFKSVPFGEYKVLATGKVGQQEFIWQEAIDVKSSVPQFLPLKQRLP